MSKNVIKLELQHNIRVMAEEIVSRKLILCVERRAEEGDKCLRSS